MISMIENETVGFYMPVIRELFGDKKADALSMACRNADSLSQIDGKLFGMIVTAQQVVDGEWKPEGGVAKTFSEVMREQRTAKTFSEIVEKYNPYHGADGRFSSGGSSGVSVSFRVTGGVDGTSLAAHITTGADGKPKISPDRQKLYNDIINKHFEGVEKQAQKSFTFMGGGGASGKTYLLESGYVDTPPKEQKKAVHINADDIKDMIPEYRQAIESGDEARQKDAAKFVHDESSMIAHAVVDMAVARGHSVVLDGTASSLTSTRAKAEAARKAGYEVVAHYVQAPLDVALEANQQRYDRTKRFVPEDILIGAHKSVSQNFEKLANSGVFDRVDLTLNDRKNPLRTIASGGKGQKLQVHDQNAWIDFLNKANYSKGK